MVLLLLGIPFRRTHTLVVGLGPDGDKGLRTQGDARGPPKPLSLAMQPRLRRVAFVTDGCSDMD